MRIRNGFVSNSSSSSFIIAFKPGKNFETALGVNKKSPVYALIKPIIDFLQNSEDITIENMEDFVGNSMPEITQAINDGWIVKNIYASDESCNGAELFFYGLANETEDINEPNFKLRSLN